jgi:hypothetical protein
MTDPNAAASDDNWLIDEDDDSRTGAANPAAIDQRLWRVLIVDDDVDVHAVTRLALRNVSLQGPRAGTVFGLQRRRSLQDPA